MMQDRMQRILVIGFVLLFFLYLFGPLLVMGITAFNTSSFPRVSPWDCFSVEWFNVLGQDLRLMVGLRNSIFIGFGVVALSVPIGLAGALMLMQVNPRLRPWYYTTVISPILVPGVVLGISTLLFWDRIGLMLGFDTESIFYNGIFLTIIGQSTFISAYTMLIFIARLQRFDPLLVEAAMDLGATHVQTFRKITLPFLKPAIGSAAVLAFLASFENYNTTVFTIVSESTLTTVLASKVRYGIDPSISALAVMIVFLTLVGAIFYEIAQRRETRRQKRAAAVARGEITKTTRKEKSFFAEPAFLMSTLVIVAGLGIVYFSGTVGVDECKAAVKEQKRVEVQRRVDKMQKQQMFKSAVEQQAEEARARGTEGYEGIFAPDNLQEQVTAGDAAQEDASAKGTEGYQSIFAPTNLEGQTGQEDESGQNSESQAKGTEQFESIFAPSNLQGQTGTENNN